MKCAVLQSTPAEDAIIKRIFRDYEKYSRSDDEPVNVNMTIIRRPTDLVS